MRNDYTDKGLLRPGQAIAHLKIILKEDCLNVKIIFDTKKDTFCKVSFMNWGG